MSLWDELSNILSGGGKGDVNRGYKEAEDYMQPYAQGGGRDFKSLEDFIASLKGGGQGYQDELNHSDKYGNAGDWSYQHAGMNPKDYYNEIMSNYNESPEAKYAQDRALTASNNGAAASGMLGSGQFQKELQENANGISQRDRGQYFNNIMGVHNSQMGDLENLQNQRERLRGGVERNRNNYGSNLWDMNKFRYGDAENRGNRSIERGNSNAKFDMNALSQLMGLFGAGAQGGMNAWSQIPQYMRNK